MRTTFCFCLFTLALVFNSSLSMADEKSHRQAVEELFTVMHLAKTMQASIEQILDVQVKQNPQIAPYREVMKRFLDKHLSLESLKEEFIKIYAEEFTEKDLKQLTAFYQTPVGKKAIEKLPKLTAQGAQLGMARVQTHQAELREMIEAEENKQGKAK